jgi:hypothetical protein
MALIGIQSIVARYSLMGSSRKSRKHLDLERVPHQGKEDIGAVLRYAGDRLIRARKVREPRYAELPFIHYAALFVDEIAPSASGERSASIKVSHP